MNIDKSRIRSLSRYLPGLKVGQKFRLARRTADVTDDVLQIMSAIKASAKYAHKARRWDLKSQALNSLGILLEDRAKALDQICESDRPHPPRSLAIKYYEIAARWAVTGNDEEQAAKCNGNIGIAMKNVVSKSHRKLAFGRLLKALKIARRVGDQRSAARYYGMMGSCVSLLGKKTTGIKLWKRALDVSADLGDTLHIAIWTANMGEDFMDIDEVEAKRLLNSAVAMFTDLKIPTHVDYCSALLNKIATREAARRASRDHSPDAAGVVVVCPQSAAASTHERRPPRD